MLPLRFSIKATIQQPSCWVCSASSGIEEHHIIPRCNGGESGPTVSLCGICHTEIHNLALGISLVLDSNRVEDYEDRSLDWNTVLKVEKVRYLAYVIHRSGLVVQDSPNRKVKFSGAMPAHIHAKLVDLVSSKLLATNQEATIFACIERVHGQLIGNNKTPR